MSKIHGQLEKARIENLTADPTGSGLVAGRMWYRTDTKRFKVYDGASIQEFVDLTSAQTLQNKILQGGTVSDYLDFTQQGSAPASPSAGLGRIYQKTDGKWYYKNSDGVEQPLGTGGGGEGVNFIENGGADVDTSGYDVYKDAAQSRPVDGTGGSPSVTISRSTVNPLTGDASFLLTKPAGNLQGEGWSYDFSIDDAYKAKVLDIEFSYLVNSGTFVAGTNTTDSDVIVYLYDVDNAVVIEPSSIKLLSNSSTISDVFRASFQTPYNSNNYRLIWHVASTSASAYELKVDQVKVSPSNYVYGTPITDWKQYTLNVTGLGSGSYTASAWYRRVGDSAEISFKFFKDATAGTGATPVAFSLPPGITIDATKKSNVQNYVVNAASTYSVEAASQFANSMVSLGSGDIRLVDVGASGIYPGSSYRANCEAFVDISVPVLGWSSSVQMSDQTDTRVVAMCARSGGGQSIPNNVETGVIFGIVDFDTHGAYNPSTGVYTVPVSGKYRISSVVTLDVGALSGNRIVYAKAAGGYLGVLSNLVFASVRQGVAGSLVADLKQGQTINITSFQNSGGAINTFANNAENVLCIERLSGPSAIAASEKFVSKVYRTSAQSIPNSSITKVQFGTKEIDTHGAFDNSVNYQFNVFTSGDFSIEGAILWDADMSAATDIQVYLYKNGVNFETLWRGRGETTLNMPFSTKVRAISGDYFDIRVLHNQGGAININGSSSKNTRVIFSK